MTASYVSYNCPGVKYKPGIVAAPVPPLGSDQRGQASLMDKSKTPDPFERVACGLQVSPFLVFRVHSTHAESCPRLTTNKISDIPTRISDILMTHPYQ